MRIRTLQGLTLSTILREHLSQAKRIIDSIQVSIQRRSQGFLNQQIIIDYPFRDPLL